MRTRIFLPLTILLLAMFLTMGIAAADEGSDLVPVESLDEEVVSSTSEETLFSFIGSILAPIFTGGEALAEDDLGGGVDNRPDH